jgi:hypothetical protein
MVPRNYQATVFNSVQATPVAEVIGSETIKVVLSDGNGDILIAYGDAVPTDAEAGYAKGCLFIDTDVATGTTGLNCNKGTNLSCVFTAVTQA